VSRDTEKLNRYTLDTVAFPILGLILSGGHTEFVYAKSWGEYTTVGATRDDSIGEAFDKVARIMDVPYPGGPELSRLATKGRPLLVRNNVVALQGLKKLPRPMLHSNDLDFSFSGIKTAAKYLIRDLGELSEQMKQVIAADFENAVTEVVLAKVTQALAIHPAHTFVLGGGVSANTFLRTQLAHLFENNTDVTLRLPADGLSTDNAVMIGMAGYLCSLRNEQTKKAEDPLLANGTLPLAKKQ